MFGFSEGVLRSPTASEVSAINSSLRPFFCRTTKHQLGVPPAEPDEVLTCPASETENRLLRLLQMKYRRNKLPLFLRILQLESNPRMLLSRLACGIFNICWMTAGLLRRSTLPITAARCGSSLSTVPRPASFCAVWSAPVPWSGRASR